MKTTKTKKIVEMIRENGGYYRTSQFSQRKITSRQIASLLEQGVISKIARGCYKLNSDDADQFEQFVEICIANPSAVIYLDSAISYHQLSNLNPHTIVFAVPREERTLPDLNIPIRRHFVSKHIYELGIIPIATGSGSFKIYDLDKTVCDVVKHRNKLGNEVLSEVLNNYLKKDGKNISNLVKYAKVMRLEKIMMQYLGVLQW